MNRLGVEALNPQDQTVLPIPTSTPPAVPHSGEIFFGSTEWAYGRTLTAMIGWL